MKKRKASATTTTEQKFVRRTGLQANEYRKNFRQIDDEVILTLVSAEACSVTPLMSKIYLALLSLPSRYWERDGILRFTGEEEADGQWRTAWQQLVSLADVSSATARKALAWMHEQGLIGYFAGRNGVGIRIFFNRAVSSIGTTQTRQSQKNLPPAQASTAAPHTSSAKAPFKESFAYSERILETDENPRAAKNTATGNRTEPVEAPVTAAAVVEASSSRRIVEEAPHTMKSTVSQPDSATMERVAKQLTAQVEAACAREYARTREWFEKSALPKAIRVGQREAYDVLRSYGVLGTEKTAAQGNAARSRGAGVGRHIETAIVPRKLSPDEIEQFAEASVALLLTQGKAIERTLAEMGTEGGGFMMAEDRLTVLDRARSMLPAGSV